MIDFASKKKNLLMSTICLHNLQSYLGESYESLFYKKNPVVIFIGVFHFLFQNPLRVEPFEKTDTCSKNAIN